MQNAQEPHRVCCEARDPAGNPSTTPQCRPVPLPAPPPEVMHLRASCADSGRALDVSITTSRPALVGYLAIAVGPDAAGPSASEVTATSLLSSALPAAATRVASAQGYSFSTRAHAPDALAAFTTCPILPETHGMIALYAVAEGDHRETGAVVRTDINLTSVCSPEARLQAQAEECAAQDFMRHLKPHLITETGASVFPLGPPTVGAARSADAAAPITTFQMLQDMFTLSSTPGEASDVSVGVAGGPPSRSIPASLAHSTSATVQVSHRPPAPVRISAALLTPRIFLEPDLAGVTGTASASLHEPATPHLEFGYKLWDRHGGAAHGGSVGLPGVTVVAALMDGDGVLSRLVGCPVVAPLARHGRGRCRAAVPLERFPAAGSAPSWVYAVLELKVWAPPRPASGAHRCLCA